jgi:predicted N-acetyltransferase YhbS
MTSTFPVGFSLRSVQGEADIQKFVSFNAEKNNPFEGATCDCLLRHHPHARQEDFWLVEDLETGEVVATTCLLPWECRHDGIPLKLAMLEMVLTHPNYRGRGLVRAQIDHFHHQAAARGFDICVIGGIPYFYRQFGYAYSFESSWEVLPAWRIPQRSDQAYSIRPAEASDIPDLVAQYNLENKCLGSFIKRTTEHWNYLSGPARHPIWIVKHKPGAETMGYLVTLQSEERIAILESGFHSADSALHTLDWLGTRGCHELHIFGAENTGLRQLAHGLGSQTVRGDQWLVRIPDAGKLLLKLSPALEKRLEGSLWKDHSFSLIINNYHNAYQLIFQRGRLIQVDPLGFVDSSMGADGGDLCIPPDAFVRLVTGFRNLEGLFDAWPDIVIKPTARALVDTLFPRLDGYWAMPYHYLGPINHTGENT